MDIVRLLPGDTSLARATYAMMSAVFDEPGSGPLSEQYLCGLLTRQDLWSYAAVVDGRPVGGLTAHVLPLTRTEALELFVYDIAVRVQWQRRGVGRAMIDRLLEDAATAGIAEMWVPADDDDTLALEFYRRTGGTAQPVTIFTYGTRPTLD